MRKILVGVLAISLIFSLFSGNAESAAGTCTAATSGNVCSLTWSASPCDDNPADGCPDADDDVVVNGKSMTINVNTTVHTLSNAASGGLVYLKAPLVLTVTMQNGGTQWSGAASSVVAEPGSTIAIGAEHNSVGGVWNGRNALSGLKLADVTIASVGACTGNTDLTVNLVDPVAGVQANDILMITSGLASAQTFLVKSVDSVDATKIVLDLAARDRFANCNTLAFSSIADTQAPTGFSRKWRRDSGGADMVAQNDDAMMGKWWLTGGVLRGPIIATEPGTAERDDFWLYHWKATGTAVPGMFAYGFELGATGVIYRPVTIKNATASNCACSVFSDPAPGCDKDVLCTAPSTPYSCCTGLGVGNCVASTPVKCSFSTWFNSGSKTNLQYAELKELGTWFLGIDGSPSTEYARIDHDAWAGMPVGFPGVLDLGTGAGTPSSGLTLEWLDIFDQKGAPQIAMTDSGNVVRHVRVRDQAGDYQTAGGQVVSVIRGDGSGATLEDVYAVNVPGLLGYGTGSVRPKVLTRASTCIGRGGNSVTGVSCIAEGAVSIDPNDLNPGKNPKVPEIRTVNSFFAATRNALSALTGSHIGQWPVIVSTVGGYSGVHNPDNADFIYRGESYQNVGEFNARHGMSEQTYNINNVARFNAGAGFGMFIELCTSSTCTPTPFDRIQGGGLSYANGSNAASSQDVCRNARVDHNTLVGEGVNGEGFRLGANVATWPTASAPTIGCDGTQCNSADPARPAWWSSVVPPTAPPDTTFKNNVIAHQTQVSGTPGAVLRSTGFTSADLATSWNLSSLWDVANEWGGTTPGSNDLLQQADPFVSRAGRDYRLNASSPGDDARQRGASMIGPLGTARSPVIDALIAQGWVGTYRWGDFIYGVDPDGDGKANISDFIMTGRRVNFVFPTAPTFPANACQNPTDLGEKCGTLKLELFRTDGRIAPTQDLIPVVGSGKQWSVDESAIVLLWPGIEFPGDLRVTLTIGNQSVPDVWAMPGVPWSIPRYTIPVSGGGSRSRHPVHPGARQF